MRRSRRSAGRSTASSRTSGCRPGRSPCSRECPRPPAKPGAAPVRERRVLQLGVAGRRQLQGTCARGGPGRCPTRFLFETIRRFKGMEREVVVLVELPTEATGLDELLYRRPHPPRTTELVVIAPPGAGAAAGVTAPWGCPAGSSACIRPSAGPARHGDAAPRWLRNTARSISPATIARYGYIRGRRLRATHWGMERGGTAPVRTYGDGPGRIVIVPSAATTPKSRRSNVRMRPPLRSAQAITAASTKPSERSSYRWTSCRAPPQVGLAAVKRVGAGLEVRRAGDRAP